MLRAGQLLPPKGLLTLRFSTGRFPPALAACYRASWQLPGPDFHRLADTSLRVDHLNVTTSWSSLCTHAAGHTKVGLEQRSCQPERLVRIEGVRGSNPLSSTQNRRSEPPSGLA